MSSYLYMLILCTIYKLHQSWASSSNFLSPSLVSLVPYLFSHLFPLELRMNWNWKDCLKKNLSSINDTYPPSAHSHQSIIYKLESSILHVHLSGHWCDPKWVEIPRMLHVADTVFQVKMMLHYMVATVIAFGGHKIRITSSFWLHVHPSFDIIPSYIKSILCTKKLVASFLQLLNLGMFLFHVNIPQRLFATKGILGKMYILWS